MGNVLQAYCRHMRTWWIDLYMFVFGEVVFAAVNKHLYPDSLPAYLGSFLEGNRTHHRWTPAMQLWGCVGFTIFDHVFGDPNVAQCCFLRRATRWQPNFRRATCHLARGAQTRSGCFCQASLSFMSQKASKCASTGVFRFFSCSTMDCTGSQSHSQHKLFRQFLYL